MHALNATMVEPHDIDDSDVIAHCQHMLRGFLFTNVALLLFATGCSSDPTNVAEAQADFTQDPAAAKKYDDHVKDVASQRYGAALDRMFGKFVDGTPSRRSSSHSPTRRSTRGTRT